MSSQPVARGVDDVFDLGSFGLRDMTRLGRTLRRLGEGAHSMEELAGRVVRRLYDDLVDLDTGERSCALVRFFKTHRYEDLGPELQHFARARLDGGAPSPVMRCLTLLGSAGDAPGWNASEASVAHRAIPLVSKEMLSKAPMISRLLQQLGVEVEALLEGREGLLVDPEPSSFNVFYVPDARGSPYIPAQSGFVAPAGVRSVLGFGGMLSRGDIFAVILFSKVPIPLSTAELFRTLALNVRMAALPLGDAVFADQSPQREGDGGAAGLESRIATLEQLLAVYERSVVEQADRLYREQERLRFQTTLLECQGEASVDGVLSVDDAGTVLFANRRLAEMWGIDPPVVGTRAYAGILQALAARTADATAFLELCAALERGQQGRVEITLADGRTFDQYTAPIRSESGRGLGRVWHFRDITAFKEMDRAKDEFVSAVSHELRTPLTSIRGSLDLLVGGVMGELPAASKPVLETAQRSCHRLVRLVNDVLDIEKIEAGGMEFRMQVLEVEPLLQQSVEALQPYGDQFGVTFRVHGSAPGARVEADPDRLAQVLGNLLSNAVRFSPPGGVVEVAAAVHGSFVRTSVVDRGEGIPRDFQARVFEKFSQGDAGSASRRRGTGLGLNIARAIVEHMGGTIGFLSRPGAGSTFYFDLPCWRANAGRANAGRGDAADESRP